MAGVDVFDTRTFDSNISRRPNGKYELHLHDSLHRLSATCNRLHRSIFMVPD